MSDIEKRVSALEERIKAVEQVLQAVPRIQPAENVDEMVDRLLADAIKDAYRTKRKK